MLATIRITNGRTYQNKYVGTRSHTKCKMSRRYSFFVKFNQPSNEFVVDRDVDFEILLYLILAYEMPENTRTDLVLARSCFSRTQSNPIEESSFPTHVNTGSNY